MNRDVENASAPETVPLQNAVLCIDCELVTTSHCDECPVCGGHSLLGLAPIVGGTLVDYKQAQVHRRELLLFDLHVSIDMSQLEGAELSVAVETLSRLIAPKLGRNRALMHISVEPIGRSNTATSKAA